MQSTGATALAVIIAVLVTGVLLETYPKLGGLLVAIIVLVLVSRGLRAGTIQPLS